MVAVVAIHLIAHVIGLEGRVQTIEFGHVLPHLEISLSCAQPLCVLSKLSV